jgi:8-oxo-dGTP pyrophosphatase MutT (NUDIX family)
MNFADSYLGRLRKKVGHDLLKVPGGRIILEDSKGKILLQKRSDFGVWGLPAGSPEEGDTASESIRREVFEETGLTLNHLECFGYSSNPAYEIFTYPNGDQVHCYSLLFYSRDWQGTPIDSNEETLALDFFSPADLPEMTRNHRRTVAKYLVYKQTGQFQLD